MLPTHAQLTRECEDAMAALDATLADLSHPLPWFEGDLNEANAKGLKPTCDENGNWRYVPAVLIDGPRVPKLRVRVSPSFPPKPYFIVDPHGRHAIGADPDEAIGKFVARYLSDEAARVAVEGKRMDEVAA